MKILGNKVKIKKHKVHQIMIKQNLIANKLIMLPIINKPKVLLNNSLMM